jgi:hypothetical protein
MKKTMRYTDLSAFSRSYGELIKTETKTIHTIEGFQAYAILDIFEYGSTFFVDVFAEETLVAPSILFGWCEENGHAKTCRKDLNDYLNSEEFKLTCEFLAAKYTNAA